MHDLELVEAKPKRVLDSLVKALDQGKAFFPIEIGSKPIQAPTQVREDTVLVVQSSGSTGNPKRVELSANAILSSARMSTEWLGAPGVWLLALPAQYIAGINVLARSIVSDLEPVILETSFQPRQFLDAIDRMSGRVRYSSLVPNQLQRLIELATETGTDDLNRLRSLDRILIGGQAMPPALLETAKSLGIRVTRTYGSSETCGGCVYDGEALASTEVRITEGQIELGGETVANRYLGDPERTEAHFFREAGIRWYKTGDLGEVVDGKLKVLGRTDDLIISGGMKVSLREIEDLVRTSAGMPEAVVVSRSSPRWGEVPVVFCENAVIGLETLRELVEARLGAAAKPEEIIVLDSIPMLPSGKPDRAGLRNR